MQKQFQKGNLALEYTIRRTKRAKRMRLSVYPGGKVYLTLPYWGSLSQGEKFIEQKFEWLWDQIKVLQKIAAPRTKAQQQKEYQEYKKKALEIVEEGLNRYNPVYNLKYTKVTIRNQKTRWGSCSSSGTLSFNYRIALLPKPLADYLIVHELCHLKEMNHSSRFWSLVAKTIPDYKKLRRELKEVSIN